MANTSPFREEISNSALEELMKIVSESPYTMQPVPPRYGFMLPYSPKGIQEYKGKCCRSHRFYADSYFCFDADPDSVPESWNLKGV